MQRPLDWAQAPVSFLCFAASAGDNDAKPSASTSAPATTVLTIKFVGMA
jgi:hypothetical protein